MDQLSVVIHFEISLHKDQFFFLYEVHGHNLVTLHRGGSVETGKYGYVELNGMQRVSMVFRTRSSFR